MEPHNLDEYIRQKYEEAGSNAQAVSPEAKRRIWQAIERRLGGHEKSAWFKLAALILLLLMPSFFLFRQNRTQEKIIAELSQKLNARTQIARTAGIPRNPQNNNKVRTVHDTVRLKGTVITRITVDTVSIIRYVTDTIMIDHEPPFASVPGNVTETKKEEQSATGLAAGSQPSFRTTEIIIKESGKSFSEPERKRRNSSLQIRIGNLPDSHESASLIKTRL